MFDVFGSVKGLIKLDSVCIDNNVFRLHYKATFVILVVPHSSSPRSNTSATPSIALSKKFPTM